MVPTFTKQKINTQWNISLYIQNNIINRNEASSTCVICFSKQTLNLNQFLKISRFGLGTSNISPIKTDVGNLKSSNGDYSF